LRGDDAPAALPAQDRGDRANHPQDCEHVHVEHRPDRGVRNLLDRPTHGVPGVVDQDVDTTVPLQGRIDGGLHGSGVGDIQSLLGGGGNTVEGLHCSGGGHHRVPSGRQVPGDGSSDAARAAGDQDDRRHITAPSSTWAGAGGQAVSKRW
jgi:hypothetical protein